MKLRRTYTQVTLAAGWRWERAVPLGPAQLAETFGLAAS